MRARAGDPPRTMAQKILSGRTAASNVGGALAGDAVEVKVDQIVLSRAPMRALADAQQAGLKKTTAEVAIAYDTRCVGERASATPPLDAGAMLAHGVLVARAGIGFPNAVHLERFAAPSRLAVTDDPRVAGVGGIGMLTLVVAPSMLGQALARGTIVVRPPRSIQVLLSGRTRPFVCARDVAIELLRRGLAEVVRKVEEVHGAPVVVEFAGPSVRLLSVAERSVLAGLAPQVGAAGALFVSDERTEVFLRDQRRSKAHRALAPDAGAPIDEVMQVDLGAVDPMLLDENGQVRAVRELAGKAVAQVLLGGDNGATLRDLLAAAALLKSKRVPPALDLLVAVPSRQMLEVLASTGALTDLIANGARLIEPDARVSSGALYPPPPGGLSARTCDAEPRAPGEPGSVVASAETLAYAVAYGVIGDPRAFKRPVRVMVPRGLPTDDVLVVRERRAAGAGKRAAGREERDDLARVAVVSVPTASPVVPWKGGAHEVVACDDLAHHTNGGRKSGAQLAVVCGSLDEVRRVAARAPDETSIVRTVIAPFIPSDTVALLSALGVAALQAEAGAIDALRDAGSLNLPAAGEWALGVPTSVRSGGASFTLTWLARGPERAWAGAGTSRALEPHAGPVKTRAPGARGPAAAR